ncbi:ATP synthase subunit O, mitochondrial-like [Vitis riparia]|uniref:ATP synthase subunit O, mitochondrial-like n=1 Tax=Vitis riparia TaxID=96939 RepID=UPI00155B0320|nr:ATP synthase subunit O, mitochondrial-like [Vitis riparia]XP_034711602.1 ATP synthase subunit O, mitochondrial-like [Vitis riparia]
MALCGRFRSSSLPLLQKLLKSGSISAHGSPVQRSLLCPALNSSEFSRNHATASGAKERKIEPLPPQEEKELKETLQDIIGHGKKVKLEQRLIPVFLVEFDQKMFDMSIKTRAREMERFLRDPINFDSL